MPARLPACLLRALLISAVLRARRTPSDGYPSESGRQTSRINERMVESEQTEQGSRSTTTRAPQIESPLVVSRPPSLSLAALLRSSVSIWALDASLERSWTPHSRNVCLQHRHCIERVCSTMWCTYVLLPFRFPAERLRYRQQKGTDLSRNTGEKIEYLVNKIEKTANLLDMIATSSESSLKRES